jgi:hypothetical protein
MNEAKPGDCGIYGLLDGDTERVVYVGRAIDVMKRFGEHVAEGIGEAYRALRVGFLKSPIIVDKPNCLAYLWIEGAPIFPILLEKCPPDRDHQEYRERAWGIDLASVGHPLSNGDRSGTRLLLLGKVAQKPPCPYAAALPVQDVPWGLKWWNHRHGRRAVALDDLPMWGRLNRERPDLAQGVLAGRFSPRAAMIHAGIRPKVMLLPTDPKAAGRRLAQHFTPDQFNELCAAFLDAVGVPRAREGDPG